MPRWYAPPGPLEFLVIVVMNALGYPLIIIQTLVSVIIALPLITVTRVLTGWSTAKTTRFYVWLYGWIWLQWMRPFMRVERRGFTPESNTAPSVVVLNHQSFFDTYFFGKLPFYDMAFAVRAWPFKMFWFRPFMEMAGYLDVESLHHRDSEARAIEVLESGARVIFYPEGHRSREGELGRFYSGAFRLAKSAGVKVVPICIDGTGHLLPPKRWWMRPARIRITGLPPVDPAAFEGELAHRELMNHVHRQVAEELERGREEGL